MTKTAEKLKVRISSPEELIWQGEADSISSVNSLGEFDILRKHANFITIIDNQPIIIRNGKEHLTFNFYYAVIHTESDSIKIFAHL